jgi:hypothetical protein
MYSRNSWVRQVIARSLQKRLEILNDDQAGTEEGRKQGKDAREE